MIRSTEAFRTVVKAARRVGTPLVAVEAARGDSLRRLVGSRGLVHGIEGFGRSAPLADLAAHFGFTPDQLAARVRDYVKAAS